MKQARRAFLLEIPEAPMTTAQAFLRHARFRLSEDYAVKISGALAELTDEQIWWRPNDASNSIGNLILHLCGNIRQWMIAGVSGATDQRDRDREFTERRPLGKDKLLALMHATLSEVDAVLAELEAETISNADAPLQRRVVPQGFAQTVLDSVFHVVEHFSYHTGQIVFIGKLLVAQRIRFYDDRQLDVRG